MYPHTIRLRGPWQYELLADDSPTTVAKRGTLVVPGARGDTDLPDFQGVLRLKRPFHWVATLRADEAVVLRLRGVLGIGPVWLNGVWLGHIQSVWEEYDFDVSRLLRPDNELILELAPPADAPTWNQDTTPTRETDPSERYPSWLLGLLNEPVLAVESYRLQLRHLSLETDWGPAGASLKISGQAASAPHAGAEHVHYLSFTIDDRHWHEMPLQNIAADGNWHDFAQVFSDLGAESWQPRGVGLPVLHRLTLQVQSTQGVWHQAEYEIGFRAIQYLGDERWRINGTELELATCDFWPARSITPQYGEPAQAPFGQWRLARFGVLHMVGHLAPDHLLALCDRVGLLLRQPLPNLNNAPPSLRATAARFACHPACVLMSLDNHET